jgi:hypothetical protein
MEIFSSSELVSYLPIDDATSSPNTSELRVSALSFKMELFSQSAKDVEPMDTEAAAPAPNVCLGPHRTASTTTPSSFTCILCLIEDDLEVTVSFPFLSRRIIKL